VYKRSISNPTEFWAEAAKEIHWYAINWSNYNTDLPKALYGNILGTNHFSLFLANNHLLAGNGSLEAKLMLVTMLLIAMQKLIQIELHWYSIVRCR